MVSGSGAEEHLKQPVLLLSLCALHEVHIQSSVRKRPPPYMRLAVAGRIWPSAVAACRVARRPCHPRRAVPGRAGVRVEALSRPPCSALPHPPRPAPLPPQPSAVPDS